MKKILAAFEKNKSIPKLLCLVVMTAVKTGQRFWPRMTIIFIVSLFVYAVVCGSFVMKKEYVKNGHDNGSLAWVVIFENANANIEDSLISGRSFKVR